MHDEYKTLCLDCGCSKHTEIADRIWSAIEDLAGSWGGEESEISNLRKLLAYARKLSK
jgi:hypothetical protein